MANLTMTTHPIHLHGHHLAVSCTDGGWVPERAQLPETTIDVPVGVIRAVDLVADAPGDWAFHCHKSHHTMNAMGHQVKNFIGVAERDLSKVLSRAAPNAMAMSTDSMAMMGDMAMPLPTNTLPMMTGTGPFGPIEMGGMFTIMKVREDLAPGDYRDPGWYKHPKGTVAYEVDVAAEGVQQQQPSADGSPGTEMQMPGMKMPMQPGGGGHHSITRRPPMISSTCLARFIQRRLPRRAQPAGAKSIPVRIRKIKNTGLHLSCLVPSLAIDRVKSKEESHA